MKHDWEFGFGYSPNTWALPIQISFGIADYGRRFGFGMRLFCFTFVLSRDYHAYTLIRGSKAHIE